MTFRISCRTISGAAALLSLGASLAVAQDTTRARSTRRIPISKEAPGEVVRVDTVTVYRTDTLNMTTLRVDTLRLTHTVYRVDTVTKFPVRTLHGGWYLGAAGGGSAPAGALFTPNSAGASFQGQLGWQGAKQVFGGRFDVNYTQPGEDSRFSGFQADPDIWNYNFDAKIQLPWLTHMMGSVGRFAVYGLGGFSIVQYKNLPMRIDNPFNSDVPLFLVGNCDQIANLTTTSVQTINGNQVVVNNLDVNGNSCGGWHSHGGWNAGGGASLQWGRTELFIESRVIAFTRSNTPMARQIPTVFGINVY
ncbi:MAG: hypothetical protein ACREPM_11435 [Gemmatimonadaceae bacterium]